MLDSLTEREKDILKLITDGKKTPEISRELQISGGTIRNYLKIMFLKTGTTNRAQLVYKTLKEGVIK